VHLETQWLLAPHTDAQGALAIQCELHTVACRAKGQLFRRDLKHRRSGKSKETSVRYATPPRLVLK
jgi:hypothetical protein